MNTQSLTLTEAKAVCSDYQYLVGHTLTLEPTDFSIIECVAIAPHDDLNKWLFAHRYMEGTQPQEAVEFNKCLYYDIILLARYKSDSDKVLYINLDNYLSRRANLDMTVEA